jgi:uncharacterized surface protein with fasciclin (FAS1) repeats
MRATKLTAIAAALVFSASLAACGDDSGSDAAAAPAARMASAAPSVPNTTATFGDGCAAVPADSADPGSFGAMSQAPVATAVSGNPLLSTLTAAVKQAGLVDTLNTAPALTVFAATNDAFKKIDPNDLKVVMDDKETLTSILQYHVVEGKLAPAQLAGTHKTLQGDEVTVEGSGTDFKVDEASVLCGNVQTANATVYLVDSVLMPKG